MQQMRRNIVKAHILRHTSIYLYLFIIHIFLTTKILWAQEYYVQSPKAPVWAEPSFQSRPVMEVAKGQQVEQLTAKGGWINVRVKASQGWMLKMTLSEEPPADITAEQRQALDTLASRARRRSSAYATTAAARGLREKREHFSRQLEMDYDALAKMKSWQADDQQIMDFMKKVQGK